MAVLPSIDWKLEDYGKLLYYDRLHPPVSVREPVKSFQTVTGSTSSFDTYTAELIDLFGFEETPPLPVTRTDWVIKRPTDEELWLSLIGIFESGDPHFAEQHDQIYSRNP
ncbi:MAG TPA: hypothetical protein VGL70_09950 [Candidatus Binatia bacterium]|jgi:hypothetical protein